MRRFLPLIALLLLLLPASSYAHEGKVHSTVCLSKVQTFKHIGRACKIEGGAYKVYLRDGKTVTTHGPDEITVQSPLLSGTSLPNTDPDNIQCAQTGGKRVQLIYARPSGAADRSSTVPNLLRKEIYKAGDILRQSGQRYDAAAWGKILMDCDSVTLEPTVMVEMLPTDVNSDSFSSIVSDLRAKGYNNSQVKYLVYYDGPMGASGEATVWGDERASSSNFNNTGNAYSIEYNSAGNLGTPQWAILLHELGHSMGAVQLGAPHTSGAYHCNDGQDVMCYSDGGPQSNYSSSVCPTTMLFDCNGDDYFNPAPVSGSYLDTHWNAAASYNEYMVHQMPLGAPSEPTNLHQTGMTASSVTLAWNAPDNASGYRYRVYELSGSVWQSVGTSQTTSYTRTGFAPLEIRKFMVRTINAQNVSSDTSVSAEASADATVLAPTSLSMTSRTSTSISLSWSGAQATYGISQYRIWRDSGAGMAQIATTTTASYTNTGLAMNASYTYAIQTVDTRSIASDLSAPQTFQTLYDPTPPSVPQNIHLILLTPGKAALAWDPSTDNDRVASYALYQITLSGQSILGTSTTNAYTRTGLLPQTTYTYAVLAKDASGNASALSTPFTFTTPADVTAPAAPTNVRISLPQSTSLKITWTAATDDGVIKGYKIWLWQNGNWTLVGNVAGTLFTMTDLTPSTVYPIAVSAYDAANNESVKSATANLSTAEGIPPTAPTNLVANPIGTSTATISWTAATDNVGVKSYAVYRYDGTNWILAASPIATYTNLTGLLNGAPYYYRVVALDAAGNASSPSQTLNFTTQVNLSAPSPAQAVSATPTSASTINLSWTASPSANVTKYRIYKIVNGVPNLLVTTTNYSYIINNLSPQTAYGFAVTAVDSANNESPPVQSASATTFEGILPTAPTHLTVGTVTINKATLSWYASTDASGISGYRIYRLSGANWVMVGSTTTALTFTNSSLVPGTAYTYMVRAVDGVGNLSTNSASVNLTTLPDTQAPTVPVSLSVLSRTSTSINLRWAASTDNNKVAGYKIYRKSGSVWNLVATVTTTSRSITGLSPSSSYTFAVAAYDPSGNNSAMSSPLTASTLAS